MLPPTKFRGRYVRLKTMLAATIAVGGLLAVAHPASAAAFTFTTIDVPGAVPGSTGAGGINNSGQIVGSFAAGARTHGFLDTGGSFTSIDVPGASGAGTIASGINDAGQVVGYFQDSTTTHGFLDVGGSFTTIDVPGARFTSAQGINDAGQIVGYFNDGTFDHGFLDTGGSFTTIDVPGTSFNVAGGINDAGQIVGTFESSFAVEHGFLATPVAEPSSLALFSVGVIVLWTIRRR
jgi:probable HAF family extracellular repeat protein